MSDRPVKHFSIDCLDAQLQQRMSPQEWRRILAFRNHPNFLNALNRYNELIPAYFADNSILNKVVTEAWRFQMLVYTLYLHDTAVPSDPRSGLTLGRLQQICVQQGIASSGRVLAIVGIMQLGGFLKRKRSQLDSRVVHLQPSDAFIAIVEGWNRRICEIVDAVVPEHQLAISHQSHPSFGRRIRRKAAETMLAGWKILDPFPEVMHFLARDAAWMLLLRATTMTLAQSRHGEIHPVSIDLESFGHRFGVSRSHFRRVLDTAFEAGLLNAPPRNGNHILLAPELIASYLTCMASELGNVCLWGQQARLELGLVKVMEQVA